MAIGEELFLASPVSVIKALFALLRDGAFYSALANTFFGICAGFFTAFIAASLLAALSFRFSLARTLLSPLFSVVKATPVASFTILAVILFGSSRLSSIMSFLMVLPVIYSGVLAGLDNTSPELREAARVFHIPLLRRVVYIYLTSSMPFLRSACAVSLGLCWKAGVAAEVIGISANTLGKKLYESKLYFDTASLFAYTAVIVVVSVLFEKLMLRALRRLGKKIEGGTAL